MPKKSDKKEIVLKTLKDHPDGLTIQEISKTGKMSRITATVYVHELLGEGVLSERKIGSYRLLFLKNKYMQQVHSDNLVKKLQHKMH